MDNNNYQGQNQDFNYNQNQGMPPQPVADTMGVGSWMGTLLLAAIPVLNIIMILVWACSRNPEKRSRKNWAIAIILWTLICIAFSAVIAFVFMKFYGGDYAYILDNLKF